MRKTLLIVSIIFVTLLSSCNKQKSLPAENKPAPPVVTKVSVQPKDTIDESYCYLKDVITKHKVDSLFVKRAVAISYGLSGEECEAKLKYTDYYDLLLRQESVRFSKSLSQVDQKNEAALVKEALKSIKKAGWCPDSAHINYIWEIDQMGNEEFDPRRFLGPASNTLQLAEFLERYEQLRVEFQKKLSTDYYRTEQDNPKVKKWVNLRTEMIKAYEKLKEEEATNDPKLNNKFFTGLKWE